MRCLIGNEYNLLLGPVLEEYDTHFVVDRSFFLGNKKKDIPATNIVPKNRDYTDVELTEEEFDKECQKVYAAFNEAHKERLENE